MRTLPVFATLALCGCAQFIGGPGDEPRGGDAGTPTTSADGGTISPGTDGGTVVDPGFTVACARADASSAPVLAGQTVEIDCTSTPGTDKLTWSPRASPAYATFSNELATTGKLWVTFLGPSLPKDFADSDVALTITATATGAGARDATLSLPVVGNVLMTNLAGGIAAYRSDGTTRSDFVGPARIAKPTMVLQLKDGTVLAGAVFGGGSEPLQLFDAHGALVRAFASTDHAGKALWEADAYPWGAAEEADGTLWVSKYTGSYSTGALLKFSTDGGFLAEVAPPGDLHQLQLTWIPQGIAVLSDGTVVVANNASRSSSPHVAIFPKQGVSRSLTLPFQVCDTGPHGEAVCHNNGDSGGATMGLLASGGELLVTLDGSSTAFVAAYSDPDLGFLRSTEFRSGPSQYGLYNLTLGSLARVGPHLLTAKPHYGCPVVIDPNTLYVPADWGDQDSGCFVRLDSGSVVRGLTQLGR